MEIPSPRARKRARIEIIPLIDIIFFLLATFVMVSLSMVKNRGIQVNLPGAETSVPQDAAERVFLGVNDQGEIYLTDVIAGLRARGEKVATSRIADPTLVLGVNSQEDLEEAERLMCLRRRAEGPQE